VYLYVCLPEARPQSALAEGAARPFGVTCRGALEAVLDTAPARVPLTHVHHGDWWRWWSGALYIALPAERNFLCPF
jgi:hypothetical protein